MTESALVARAATPMNEIVHAIAPDQLRAVTPCTEYDVRGLLNHLLFWAPSLEAAARKEFVPPPAQSESEVVLADGDWARAVDLQLDRSVAAWSRPAAWEGITHMGSPRELPAGMVGGMVLSELVVHGWDLARATGQHAEWDPELLVFVHDEVAKTAEQGREMGVYGPAVEVTDEAPTLDRVLGLTGRDPGWAP